MTFDFQLKFGSSPVTKLFEFRKWHAIMQKMRFRLKFTAGERERLCDAVRTARNRTPAYAAERTRVQLNLHRLEPKLKSYKHTKTYKGQARGQT